MSNVQRRILNKVFCQFINWRSKAISSFDVQRWMFDVRRSKNALLDDSISLLLGRLPNALLPNSLQPSDYLPE